jgi:predicted negative regulator of RcsB-dependent stress response
VRPGDPGDSATDFDDDRPEAGSQPARRPPARGGPSKSRIKLAAVAAIVVLLVASAIAWRAHHRRRVVREGLARAGAALRADTHAGWRDAERLLEPLVELDPVDAAAMRGFALSMLALDYRDADAAKRAEALLVEPGRASEVPALARLAYAALALTRNEAGTALGHVARAGDQGWGAVLQARVALLANKVPAAREPLDRAVAADPAFPAVQALRGDALRRAGHAAQAREAYVAALAASPAHPRAAFGLAKLALGGAASPDDARAALGRLLDDPATPPVERARAAYHLASVEARAGRAAESAAAAGRAGVDGAARGWLDRAVAQQAQAAGYEVVQGAPRALDSALDDDPWAPPARPAPSNAVSPTFRLPEPPPRASAPTGKAKAAAASSGSAAKKPAARPAATAAKKSPAKAAPAKPAATASKKTTAKKPAVAKQAPARTPAAKPARAPAKAGAAPSGDEKARSAMERAIRAAAEQR